VKDGGGSLLHLNPHLFGLLSGPLPPVLPVCRSGRALATAWTEPECLAAGCCWEPRGRYGCYSRDEPLTLAVTRASERYMGPSPSLAPRAHRQASRRLTSCAGSPYIVSSSSSSALESTLDTALAAMASSACAAEVVLTVAAAYSLPAQRALPAYSTLTINATQVSLQEPSVLLALVRKVEPVVVVPSSDGAR
jgi:hypothetical protein